MPQVPTSFVPQVNDSGATGSVQFVAPGIAPMENLAAQQQVQLGQTTQSVGQALWRIGQIMTDDINSARAKQADSQFLDFANDILRGNGGYMYSQGQDAEARFQAAQDAIAQRAQAIQDSLDNNVQRQMFQQATARNISNFRTQMHGHRSEQVVKWTAQESAARAERYVGEAVNTYETRGDNATDRNGRPTGKFAVNLQNAMDEAVKSARLAGYPDDSEAMLGVKRKVMDDVAKGVVGRLMQDDDYGGGIRYIESVRGQMSPAAYESLLGALKVNRDRQMVGELTDSIMQGRGLSTVAGTDPFVNPVKTPTRTTTVKEGVGELEQQARGGVIIEAQPGSQVVAPYGGVIMGVDRDGGNLTIAVQLENGDVAMFSGMSGISEDAVSLYEGKVVGRGETIGIMGNSPIQYSLSRDGKNIPLEQVNSIAPGETPRLPASEQEALAMANGIDDKDIRAGVRTMLRAKYAERAEADKQSYDSMLAEATQLVARGQEIPDPIFASLTPKDRKALTTPFADYDSVSALEETYRSPGIVTHDWLAENKGKFTEGTWNSLMGKANAASKDAATVDARRVTVRLLNNGLDKLASPEKDADKADSLRLRESIQRTLEDRRKRGPMSDEDADRIIDQAIMNWGTIKYQGWFIDSVQAKKPTAAMTDTELGQLMLGPDAPSDYYGERTVRVLDANGNAKFLPAVVPVKMDDGSVVPVSQWTLIDMRKILGREPTQEEIRETMKRGAKR